MKYFLLSVFALLPVYANTAGNDRAWIESVVSALLDQKDASVYAAGSASVAIVESSSLLRKKSDCMTAEIILADNDTVLPMRCKTKQNRILYRSYEALKRDPFALGAAYRHKGRQNLLFVQSRIKYFGITLPEKFRRYVEKR